MIDYDVEQIEFEDWGVNNGTYNHFDKKQIMHLSISAYYVDRWIDRIKNDTFETVILPLPTKDILNDLPSDLPFDRCMVRYVHCSPKDSEFWGECRTKNDVRRVFTTSLRCHKNHGDKIVFRRWDDRIEREYRLFWNGRLCAGSLTHFDNDATTSKTFQDDCEKIVEYLKTVKIPFYRCVVDVAILNTSDVIVIEFNSWESNSGCHMFDWIDTVFMYPEIHDYDNKCIVFRSSLREDFVMKFDKQSFPLIKNVPCITGRLLDTSINKIIPEPHNPTQPGWWILRDNLLYVATDLFLVMIDTITFIQKIWTRHTNRFSPIFLYSDDTIVAGDEMYDKYLTKLKKNYAKINDHKHINDRLLNLPYRYGFFANVDGVDGFVRVSSSGRMYFV